MFSLLPNSIELVENMSNVCSVVNSLSKSIFEGGYVWLSESKVTRYQLKLVLLCNS